MMAERRLLEPIAHELQKGADDTSLAVAGRARRLSAALRGAPGHADQRDPARLADHSARHTRCAASCRHRHRDDRRKEPRLSLGMLPLARRDVERLRQILGTAAAADGHEPVAARAARADAPRSVPRGADVARDSRAGAGRGRALARVHRSGRRLRGRAGERTDKPAPSPPAAPAAAAIVPTGDQA